MTALCTGIPLNSISAQSNAHLSASAMSAVLKPGDKIRVKIWREPDLSGEFELPLDGVVLFPKIGRVAVGLVSPDSLRSLLTTRYGSSLRDPEIEVTPLRRVGVRGAVRSPGYYYADPTITVTGAVLLAGGSNEAADAKHIELLRNGQHFHISQSEGQFRDDSPVQSGDEISVEERSWASRNIAVIASAITGVALIVATVIR